MGHVRERKGYFLRLDEATWAKVRLLAHYHNVDLRQILDRAINEACDAQIAELGDALEPFKLRATQT